MPRALPTPANARPVNAAMMRSNSRSDASTRIVLASIVPDAPDAWEEAIEQALRLHADLRDIAGQARDVLTCAQSAAMQQSLWSRTLDLAI